MPRRGFRRNVIFLAIGRLYLHCGIVQFTFAPSPNLNKHLSQMKTHTTTNYAAPIFYVHVNDYAKNGENAITETTFESFLREFVEDPAAAWVVKKNEDGNFEVRTNYFNQYTPGKLHGTFDNEAEAEQFLLDGLNWDFSNKYTGEVSYDFDRAELVKFLNEASADL